MENKAQGTLYLCPTPIGNLEDITFRTLKILKQVDLIAAEDTRHTIRLLNYFEIKKPLTSYHEHNKREKGPILINKLLNGEDIALVTDAGMPAISDPGEDLVKLAIENNVNLVALPGPTAFVLALVVSGFSTRSFIYEGFLSQNKKSRREELEKFISETRTVIIYESPHRLKDLLKDMSMVLGNRNLSISRELTKKYEEIFRGTTDDSIEKFTREDPRGEFIVVIEGISKEKIESEKEEAWEVLTIKEHLMKCIDEGMTKKEAIKMVSKQRKVHKNAVYQEALELE